MPTYIYETIAAPGEETTHHEIEQTADAPELTVHPGTAQPIRRVIVDGAPLVKKDDCCGDDATDSCCGGDGTSCC